ncbi:hypothetical protein CCHL11_01390 [Colletotrichum chlorophyti]|uniref:Uncharacterized protein n=1 Tax=Colletotrichum chlorophyti TaxID=708187 RepID=A0A1Q8RYI8_9PEZI|nr:hypothetical protein CCHL11_01390 [Colletotrichum chlorophyti]
MTSSTRPASSAVQTQDAPAATKSQHHRQDGLPMSVRVAIASSSVIFSLAILAFLVCLFRRRSHRGYTQSIRSEIKHHSLPQASSPTLLISPLVHGGIHHTTLAPPPRLKERRLLPILLGSGRPSIDVSIPGTPFAASIAQTGGFAPSPISQKCNDLGENHDRSPKVHARPALSVTTRLPAKARNSASLSSAATEQTATTVSNASSGMPYLTLSSPNRPPRPHETPLRIPDLVCPGPPPNRSLPPPPPLCPRSPFRQAYGDASSRRINAAVNNGWVPPRNPARDVVLDKDSRDLCDLTESCARESKERDSWGSWNVGVGGTGVGASSVQRGGSGGRERVVNSPVLEEGDLERMGGSYR